MKSLKLSMAVAASLAVLLTMMVTAQAASVCVSPGGTGGCFSSIQTAINAASAGDTVLIKEGRYSENVVVTKPLQLAGEDKEDVIIRPAISNPNPCSGSSLCGGAASNIILVQADNVTIHDLTLDGDNPNLTSGIVRGGADVDARNGIITNHPAGTFNNLVVHDIKVKNIYLRGIYASSGGTFNFHDNEVRNVQGDYYSICIFNFGGSGIMKDNEVSDCNDALSSNWSGGVKFLNNEIKHSGSGIHTDNAGGFGGGNPDLIQGNKISNSTAGGYGIFVFVPYLPVTVKGNTLTDVDVGLAAFGQGADVTTAFINNIVDAKKRNGSTGVFVTTDQLGYGANHVSVLFTGNLITQTGDGFVLNADPGVTLSFSGSCNGILRNANSGMTAQGSGATNVSIGLSNFNNNTVGVNNQTLVPINAGNNWWGCKAGPGAPGCDKVMGNVNVAPLRAQPSKCAPSGLGENDD